LPPNEQGLSTAGLIAIIFFAVLLFLIAVGVAIYFLVKYLKRKQRYKHDGVTPSKLRSISTARKVYPHPPQRLSLLQLHLKSMVLWLRTKLMQPQPIAMRLPPK